MQSKLLVANWKMNKGLTDGFKTANLISKKINNFKNKKYVLLPSLQSIFYIKNKLSTKKIIFGSQDCSQFKEGAYTGDISASMIKEIGCKYVLIGHSERRENSKENNVLLLNKLERASENKLKIIFCVGESLSDYKNKKRKQKLKIQLTNIFSKKVNLDMLIIAYEPVWAIGKNITPNIDEIDEIHLFIKEFMKRKYNVDDISVLYGGSVNSKNSREIFSLVNVNGGLIGGASLIASEFCKIYDTL